CGWSFFVASSFESPAPHCVKRPSLPPPTRLVDLLYDTLSSPIRLFLDVSNQTAASIDFCFHCLQENGFLPPAAPVAAAYVTPRSQRSITSSESL
ncbi:hypothetical protein T310_9095, partial [Rasamsonia emersonii CBS 393.64]